MWKKISDADYFGSENLNFSKLKLLLRSPRSFLLTPDLLVTPAMKLGTLGHLFCLPGQVPENIAVEPNFDRRKKGEKEASEKFTAENIGKIILSENEYNWSICVQEAVKKNPITSRLFKNGISERAGFATIKDVPVKIKPDFLKSNGVMVDLKFTTDATEAAFMRKIFAFSYHMQAAFYFDVANLIQPGSAKAFVWAVVETSFPHSIGVYQASENMLQFGRELYQFCLLSYSDSLINGFLGDLCQNIQILEVPPWWKK